MDLSKYVGIKYVNGGRDVVRDNGLDCYGFCILLYKELFNILLPLHEDIDPSVCGQECCSDQLYQSSTYKDFEQVDVPQFGDIIILKSKGVPIHIGMVLDNTNMLHCNTKTGSVIENFRSIRWKNKISGFYRHKNFSQYSTKSPQ